MNSPHAHPPSARTTRQREAIRAGIEQAARPLTPAEVLAAAQVQVPGLGIATVYRNLKLLEAEGHIRAVDLPGQAPRYEIERHAHLHHFHCRRCDRMFPIHACPGSIEQLAPQGFTVERHDLTLHGLCADCMTADVTAGAAA